EERAPATAGLHHGRCRWPGAAGLDADAAVRPDLDREPALAVVDLDLRVSEDVHPVRPADAPIRRPEQRPELRDDADRGALAQRNRLPGLAPAPPRDDLGGTRRALRSERRRAIA